MKQVAQSIKDGRIQVLEVPAPSLQPHGILVRTAWSLISAGTERAKVDLGQKSLLGKARSRPDQVAQVVAKIRRDGLLATYRTVKTRLEELNAIGYSSSGVVLAVGELAGGFRVGDRVACGGGEFASHAEVAYVPGTLAVHVHERVGLDQAAFATVGAVALQGIRQSGATIGDRVAVVGLGLLGQLTVQLLRAAGCEVSGMDPDESRCALAAKSGAVSVSHARAETAADELLAATKGNGFDAVILTAATRDSGPIRLAGQIARDRGTVIVVGDVGMDIPRSPFYEKELTVRLSRSYGPGRYNPTYEDLAIDYPPGYVRWTEQRNMAEFIRLLAERAVKIEPLLTHRFAVDRAVEAYDALSAGKGGLGVLLEYPESATAESKRIMVAGRRSAPTESLSDDHDRVGLSLLGAGNFATATLLPALTADPRVLPRGVHTASGLSARDVAQRFRFGFCAGSAEEVLSDSHTDAVVIATRHASHAELAEKALRAGKTVFVEKPLALTEEQLAGVVSAQRETGGLLTVGFNRRFSPCAATLVASLQGRTNPAVLSIRVNAGDIPPSHWTQRLEEGGGRILGEVCHFVDLASFITGSHPNTVYAVAADPDRPAALADSLTITLSYPDGSVATVLYTSKGDTSYPKERVEAFCEGKVMVIDDFRTLTLVQGGRTTRHGSRRVDKGHVAEMRAFLDLAQGKTTNTLTFADCVASTTATFKVIESLSTGGPVTVPLVVAE